MPDQQESFLTKLLKRENPQAFVKCFTNNASSMARGGMERIDTLIKSLQVSSLQLFPRIKPSIIKTLEDLPNLKIIEYDIEFSKNTFKI